MTPAAFAALHPRLYRLAERGSLDSIRRHGLLPAADLARLAGHPLPPERRAAALRLTLPDGTPVTITDNAPLSMRALGGILDDGLAPADWMAMLNARVFFWPDRALGAGNLAARLRLGYRSEWHVFDTARLLAPVWDRAEVAPINTGATLRAAARRGRATFAPLATLDWDAWRRARPTRALDRAKEVTVRGPVPHAADAIEAIEPAR
ncbi:DUF7002 family protein [Jannaschia sp. LMIT008]|uniref:DUF7002 family protein n=1 Tax=Jannaschia maritima TaxID=3032585 RepID=UPI0028120FC1|nr:hypothetical protein [Jannaschia sp. LMIT008]